MGLTTIEDAVNAIAETKLNKIIPRGNELTAACPFHKGGRERKPSFSISRISGKWYCHACGAGGDLHSLAKALGVSNLVAEIKREKRRIERVEITELPISLLGVFHKLPKMMLDFGFEKSILAEHSVGFDNRPDFRRITFPVISADGKLRFISGRSIDDDFPKYLIYGKKAYEGIYEATGYTPQKGLWLYRENLIKHDDPLIVTEGFKACLWLAQMGLNSTAVFGKSLTEDQAVKIRRINPPHVYLFLDNDKEGIRGTSKVYKKLLKAKYTKISIARYPEMLDTQPDDLSEDEVRYALTNPMNYLEFSTQYRKTLIGGRNVVRRSIH